MGCDGPPPTAHPVCRASVRCKCPTIREQDPARANNAMPAIIWLLLVLNVAIPVRLVWRRCISHAGIEFNHLLLFSLGFLVYWIVPILVGVTRSYNSEPVMGLWYQIFDQIPQEKLVQYLVICPCLYLSFYFGSALGDRKTRTPYCSIVFDRRMLNGFLIIGIIAAGIFAFILRGELFRGYTSIVEEFGLRGTFTACSLFLLALAVLYSTKSEER